jgi:sporulation protein YlmC with PRC-barrel domain
MRRTVSPWIHMYASDLENKEVISKNGTLLGRSTNAEIDTTSWKVTSVEIELEGDVAKELNVKKFLSGTTVPISVEQVEAVGNKILLKTNKEDIAPHIVSAASTTK